MAIAGHSSKEVSLLFMVPLLGKAADPDMTAGMSPSAATIFLPWRRGRKAQIESDCDCPDRIAPKPYGPRPAKALMLVKG
jgi:hypothetical protein